MDAIEHVKHLHRSGYLDIDSLNRARVRLVNTRIATHIQVASTRQALFHAAVYKKEAGRAKRRGLVDQARRWRQYARGYLARACEISCGSQQFGIEEGGHK